MTLKENESTKNSRIKRTLMSESYFNSFYQVFPLLVKICSWMVVPFFNCDIYFPMNNATFVNYYSLNCKNNFYL